MRVSNVLLTVAVLTSACGGSSDEAVPVDPTAARVEANKAMILKLNDAQNAWDFETMASLMAPDLKRHCQATPESPVNSRDEYLALLKAWQSTIPDAHQTVNYILGEGDMVAVHVTLSGTQTGQMGAIPPTGKRFDSNALAMFRIEAGKIAEIWVEWDNVAILTQLGVFPPSGSAS